MSTMTREQLSPRQRATYDALLAGERTDTPIGQQLARAVRGALRGTDRRLFAGPDGAHVGPREAAHACADCGRALAAGEGWTRDGRTIWCGPCFDRRTPSVVAPPELDERGEPVEHPAIAARTAMAAYAERLAERPQSAERVVAARTRLIEAMR